MGAWEAYSQAFRAIFKKPAFLILYTVVSLLCAYASHAATPTNDTLSLLFSVLPSIVFAAALPVYGLSVADKRESSVTELMRVKPRVFLYALVASILMSIIFVGSLILLIIPIIWTAAWYAYTLFPVVESDATPANGLDISKSLGKTHKFEFWEAMVLPVVFGIASVYYARPNAQGEINLISDLIVTTIGSFMYLALFSVLAMLYRWLQRQPHDANVAVASEPATTDSQKPDDK